MNIIKTVVIACFIVVALVACDKKMGSLPKTEPIPSNVCDSATYSLKIKKLVLANCAVAGCHESGFPNGDFTNYNDLKAKADIGALRLRVLNSPGNPMPPVSKGGMLPADKRKLIECWLDNGAKSD